MVPAPPAAPRSGYTSRRRRQSPRWRHFRSQEPSSRTGGPVHRVRSSRAPPATAGCLPRPEQRTPELAAVYVGGPTMRCFVGLENRRASAGGGSAAPPALGPDRLRCTRPVDTSTTRRLVWCAGGADDPDQRRGAFPGSQPALPLAVGAAWGLASGRDRRRRVRRARDAARPLVPLARTGARRERRAGASSAGRPAGGAGPWASPRSALAREEQAAIAGARPRFREWRKRPVEFRALGPAR